MKKALLIGNYGVGNLGDEALRQFFLDSSLLYKGRHCSFWIWHIVYRYGVSLGWLYMVDTCFMVLRVRNPLRIGFPGHWSF